MGYTECIEVEDSADGSSRDFTPLEQWAFKYVEISKSFSIEDDLKYLRNEYIHYVKNEPYNWPLRNHISDLLEHVSKIAKGK